MNLPEQPAPSAFPPAPEPEHPWRWRLEDASGAEVVLGADDADLAGRTFATQGDAESWIGETWSPLFDLGVAQVTLFEFDREVYGPMSLSA